MGRTSEALLLHKDFFQNSFYHEKSLFSCRMLSLYKVGQIRVARNANFLFQSVRFPSMRETAN